MKLIVFLFLVGGALFALNLYTGVFEDVFGLGARDLNTSQEGDSTGVLIEERREIVQIPVQELEKEVSAPPPIRTETESLQAVLIQRGVFQWTNVQREKNGLPQLTESAVLNSIAASKVADMFQRQYFEHVSPSGEGVGDLAETAGYEFIAIGENLALGDYKDDEALVQAWMDSPGHRENILNERYQEVGVAVEKGVFEGRSTWLAVQTFGLPLSVCPRPAETLKGQIDLFTLQVNELETILNAMRAEIRDTRPKRGSQYNEKVEEYNKLVDQYNSLVTEIQDLIFEYNSQVQAFNECANSPTK